MENFTKYPHRVLTELYYSLAGRNERTAWCIATFGGSGWLENDVICTFVSNGEPARDMPNVTTQCFSFQQEEDAIMFKLVWGGHYAFDNKLYVD